MKKTKTTGYLRLEGYYDNGHEQVYIDPTDRYTKIINFANYEDQSTAINYIEQYELRYLGLMYRSILRYKRQNRRFNSNNVKARVIGYIDIEEESTAKTTIVVFEHTYDYKNEPYGFYDMEKRK